MGESVAAARRPWSSSCARRSPFDLESRGIITVKGKGELPAWFVRGPKVAKV